MKKLDDAVTTYLNEELFFKGEAVASARATVFGIIWARGLPKERTTLPRARRALSGYAREEPAHAEDPAPIEAVAVIASKLLDENGLLGRLSGLAMLVEFDLFTRPSETLEIRKEDVIVPKGQYKTTSVIIAPLPTKPTTAKAATRAAPKAAKSGEFDDTVLAGLPGLGLEWAAELVQVLKQQAVEQQRLLDPLTLTQYERYVSATAEAIDLGKLRVHPHSMRHGGASLAAYLKCLDAPGIKGRGRWNSERSVRRYEKKGRLTRQVAKMDAKQVALGGSLLRDGILKKKALMVARSLRKVRLNARSPLAG